MKKFFSLRRDYNNLSLNFNELEANPMDQFDLWFSSAQETEANDPNAMSLATSTPDGKCSSRYVLIKAYDEKGIVFFTNYESRKSLHIETNPYGSMAIYWPKMQRQVRAEGEIILLDKKYSDEYFDNRPNGSKIGAWASPQSKPIPNREYLEKLKQEYEKKYTQFKIPRPEYWGGFKLIPERIEFWQGRSDRLHDRFEYQLKNNIWVKERLAP